MRWRFANPTPVHFGPGCLEELPALVGEREAVVLAYPEAAGTGLVRRLESLLGERLRAVITDVPANPDVAGLDRLYEDFWHDHARCDVLVAVGGGSTLDTAKVLAVGSASGRFDDLMALLRTGIDFEPARTRPLIAVPTTAGTGSEVTGWATVWDKAAARKHSLALAQTWPEAALIDPALALGLPAGPTLSAGLDALSHALEAIWNIHHNPVSDSLAVSAARLVLATLPGLMGDLDNLERRTRMAQAALMAGLAFSNTRTALAHSISYEMTLRHGLPHGLACSFTLPMVLERAIGVEAGRDAVLASVFDVPLVDAPEYLHGFIESLGLSTRFEDHGVAPEAARRMVADALEGVRGRNFLGRKTA